MSEICLRAKNVTKIYPGTRALDEVSVDIYSSKVNVLVGENGAGKSTLMKIFAGVEQPSSGTIEINGKDVQFYGIRDAEAHGIGIIHQELNLFPNLSVAQNLFMAREEKKYGIFVDDKKHYDRTVELLDRLEHRLNPNIPVSELKVGEQQILEIAKTMAQHNLRVLIMDEPTSSLSAQEVSVLFNIIEELKSLGIAIIYISHRMDEIMQIGDYVTILRDGRKVAQDEVKNIDITWMVDNMIGRKNEASQKSVRNVSDEEILRVESLTLYRKNSTNKALDNVSFSLKKGEILGIYGLLGAGRTELLETLMGLNPHAQGKFFLRGKQININNVNKQIERGFAFVPEDRQREGLIQKQNILKNMTISSLQKYCKFGFLSKIIEYTAADKKIQDLSIKVADKNLPILSLSGGNQQKVVIAKGLLTDPIILLLDEPSRGIDVGAKAEVSKIIRGLADNGLSIIVVASELKEIIDLSDRIIVLANGVLSGEFDAHGIAEWQLASKASSH